MSEAVAPAGISRLLSDERLTRRAVGGDERAFGAIFRRYHQPLYRFCLAILGNPEDAQDALQNTMMKVLRALPGEEREIELKPWLYRIAHNESIDLLRRRRETRPLDFEQAAPGRGLAEDAATRERLRRLLADMRELPERQREVLVMREVSGLGFEEIGVALGTSSATIRQTLYEARLSLRQMEEGREMSCDEVTRALSDGDGRVIRRRDLRAHLRSCAGCRGFREEIKGRRQDLAALSPLPAVAAAGMLQGLVGGSQAAGGTGLAAALGGGAAKTIATSAAVKGVATVAVVAAVGVGTADRTGVIHLGLPGEDSSQSSTPAPGAADVAPGKSARGHAGSAVSDGAGAGESAGSPAHGKLHAGSASTGAPAKAHPEGKDRGQGHEKGFEGAQPGSSGGERAGGREAQLPEAAAGGQGNSAGQKGEAREPGGADKSPPEAAGPKPKPEAAPSPSHPPPGGPAEAPSKGAAPENPPRGAAPEAPPQAHQPQPPAKAPEAPPQGPPASPGNSAEAPGRQ
ncbi:MAG TPA: sigma-70 family RNA polymerase sigma factor [Solirubrobacterales bacterium]|nr:sigma-70 family RNA polymerase sigma factor [Solirubrobacterales bacterium]